MFPNTRNKFALLMGNHLESCKEDVCRMKILLEKDNFLCKTFINCFPMKEILTFISHNTISTNDLLYIHFSGHGKLVGKKIMTKIEMLSIWINFDFTYCYSNDIDKILSQVNGQIILVSDTCHSENFGKFYMGNSPYLFIGSSSSVNLSNEYQIGSFKNSGVLTCFFEYILSKNSINKIEPDLLNKSVSDFFNKYKIRIRPIIKTINFDDYV